MRSEKGLWKILAAGMCLLGGLMLGGCSLALEEIPKAAEQQDRLVGIFVTTEYLPSGELELEVSWTGKVSVKEQERRIYGTINGVRGDYYERQTVSFEGVEGWGIYDLSLWNEDLLQWEQVSTADAPFADRYYRITDGQESMEAVLYVPERDRTGFYFNPVYQQEDGRVYLVQGHGLSVTGSINYSQTLEQTLTYRENDQEVTEGQSFTVQIVSMPTPEEGVLLFMNQDNRVVQQISQEQLEALCQSGTFQLEVPTAADYLILQQTKAGSGERTRSIYSRGEENMELMLPGEGDFLYKWQLSLVWE